MYGLIGNPLGHSYSAMIHKKLGYDYTLQEVEPEALEAFVNSRRFTGYNVTIPYKRAIMPLLDVIDKTAEAVGAVNTVIDRAGVRTGYNTDLDGMAYAMRSAGIRLRDKSVVILGTGGTSHTAVALVRREGARKVTIVSRKGEWNYDNYAALTDTEIVINTTPVGMYPDNGSRPVDLAVFPRLEGVFDAVYNPLKTRLILQAESLGAKCAGGLKMLVAQAVYARNLFLEEAGDDALIETVYDALLKEVRNLVLVGMPGSGKSTIGFQLARFYGMPFVDVDRLIERNAGKTVAAIFDAEGEAGFRQRERRAIEAVSKRKGIVIATGGGAVCDAENRLQLRGNGTIIYLKRDAQALATDGRPLSTSLEKLCEMEAVRAPIYASVADLTVDNNGGIGATVAAVLKELG